MFRPVDGGGLVGKWRETATKLLSVRQCLLGGLNGLKFNKFHRPTIARPAKAETNPLSKTQSSTHGGFVLRNPC